MLSAAISKCPPGSNFYSLLILRLLLKCAKNCKCSLFVVGHCSTYAIKYRHDNVNCLIAQSKSDPKYVPIQFLPIFDAPFYFDSIIPLALITCIRYKSINKILIKNPKSDDFGYYL